ncbi:Ldh family oxidoreductase [Martelella sp. HB161492]|uniref:Ldh family oxidoreductase n=1 Tax=Martelella sp. HB161492 TaxID=2720726 RepID=UPI00158FDFD0|nr:Ldh family oxidoreductase [Martelella sp. HB161492]
MDDVLISVSEGEANTLAMEILKEAGFSQSHAEAITQSIITAQRDECHSHGLYRLISCTRALQTGRIDPAAEPSVDGSTAPAIIRADARHAISLLAFQKAMPLLVERSRSLGMAALAINNCYHFSALWPEAEALAAEGLVAIVMTVSHAWVAPAGGNAPAFGTNPIAFAWPRPGRLPFVFDFATSAIARGELELCRREGRPLPHGVAVDRAGNPTTDPEAAAEGAMLTFGGYKGSALSAMIELMAGPLIGDMTSAASLAYDSGTVPCHGEIILAFDPARFMGNHAPLHLARGEALFDSIVSQGARLPSARRHLARKRNSKGQLRVRSALWQELQDMPNERHE